MKKNRSINMQQLMGVLLLAFLHCFVSCGKDKGCGDPPPPSNPGNKMEIISFSPGRGVPGTTVKITGKHFHATASRNEVWFNGASLAAVVTGGSTHELTVKVPADATTGNIIVKNGNQADTSATAFIVDPQTVGITDFNPKQGPFGTTVTITGTKLGDDITVKMNNVTAALVSRSATAIVFTIPTNTTLTAHKITVVSGTDILETAENFTVTATGPYASWQNKNITFLPGASVFTGGASFVYKNKIYWGFTRLSFAETKADYVVFDPAQPANGWALQPQPPADMAPAQWQHAVAIVHNDRVFMGTGLTPAASNQWWEFLPETNTSKRLTDYPEPTSGAVSFVVNNQIYVGFGGNLKQLYRFNAAGNNNMGSWDVAATASFRELHFGKAFVLGNEVLMGRVLPVINQPRNAIYKFTEPDQLTAVTSMPDDVFPLGTPAFTIGNKGYFVINKNVWEYTPSAAGGSWRAVISQADAPVIRQVAVVMVNGARVVYGWTDSGSLYEFKI